MANDMNRDDLLRLTPRIYLRDGYRDGAGKLRPRLRGLYATAAAAQFEHAEVSPQELAGTLEALRQVLPWHKGEAQDLLRDAVSEALELAASLYKKENHPAIVAWLEDCADFVHSPEDIDAFMQHSEAVARIYNAMIALKST